MKRIFPLIVLFLSSGCEDSGSPVNPDPAGPYAWTSVAFDTVMDHSRGRVVPTTIYHPTVTDGGHPVVVLSHGLGGSRTTYAYLAGHLASHGYVVLVPEHVGSSRGAPDLIQSIFDTDEWLDRAADVGFLLDIAESYAAWQGWELGPVGVVGHSYGAITAQFVAGALANMPDGLLSLRDPRVDAIVGLSPAGDNELFMFTPESFGEVTIPSMMITGTRDRAETRRAAYDLVPPGDKFLLILDDVDHLDFIEAERSRGRRARTNRIVRAMTVAFFDVHLRGRERSYLNESFADGLTGPAVRDVHWEEK